MLLILQNIFSVIVLGTGIFLSGCGDATEPEGTVFDPPAWVLALADGQLVGDTIGDTTTTTGGSSDFHGVQATIADVAEPLIVAEASTVAQETDLTKTLTAAGIADDGATPITLTWTVLQTVSPPVGLTLVVTPVTSGDQATFFYTEGTATTGNAVTAIVSGVLDLNKWNDIQVRGTFDAQVILADDTVRTISDGIIDVRF